MQEPTPGPEPEAPARSEGTAGAAVSDVSAEPGYAVPGYAVPAEGGAPGGSAGSARPPEPAGPTGSDGAASDGAAEPAGDAVSAEPAGPQPLGIGITPTGDAAVDARLARLADADHLPAAGHLDVYEDVHRGLRDALAALDQRPGPPAPTRDTTYDNRS